MECSSREVYEDYGAGGIKDKSRFPCYIGLCDVGPIVGVEVCRLNVKGLHADFNASDEDR